ncbi:sphingomyelin phosphodiesterase [Leptospira alstonii]|nr:sphingomyelin phosphodiesterase [Leptospira alstonii]
MRTKRPQKLRLLVSCCLVLFLSLSCSADKQTSYFDLLMLLFVALGNENANSENLGPDNSGPENPVSATPRAANPNPADLGPADSGPAGSGPAGSGSTGSGSTGSGSTGSGSTGSGSTGSNVEIKILSHNVSIMSASLSGWGNWGQNERAERIASSDYIKNQDVIVFEGLSDDNGRKILLDGIRATYPYQTDVIGRTQDGWNATFGTYRRSTSTNGGVVVVSKWPIEERIQYIFNNPGCGADASYHKGFAYVRIDKNGKKFHIVGTQVQTKDAACADSGKPVRAEQFNDIVNFIALKKIPNNETVLIAGDLNVHKGSGEYYDMLNKLNVNPSRYAGVPFTWNTKNNGMAAFRRPNEAPAYSAYILVSKSHAQPPVWQNLAYDPISPRTWKRPGGYTSYEFSERYPVYGFVYADVSTPTRSGHRRKYDQVSFVSAATGKRIQANSDRPNGWLKADTTEETDLAKFNLLQEGDPDSNPSCITGGFVRIESSFYLNYFWSWWFGGGNANYAYYPGFNNGSNRLEIVNILGGCLGDGSRIAFKDYNTALAKYYYLTVWNTGNWSEHIFLWMRSVSPRETFYLRLNSTPERDWSRDLIYR